MSDASDMKALEERVARLEKKLRKKRNEKPRAACRKCKGSGKHPGLHNACGRCWGSGYEEQR